MKRDYPQIDNGKKPTDGLNIVHFSFLQVFDDSYGNLQLKCLKIVSRIDWVNIKIAQAIDNFSHTRAGITCISTRGHELLEHQLIIEEIVYWLRKTADEIIALSFIIYRETKGKVPHKTKLQFDKIGVLLQNKSNDFAEYYKEHHAFLEQLNEISNAYKHSFINSDHRLIGAEEPTVIALDLKHNDLNNMPKLYQLLFRNFIENYNKFYVYSINLIRSRFNQKQ